MSSQVSGASRASALLLLGATRYTLEAFRLTVKSAFRPLFESIQFACRLAGPAVSNRSSIFIRTGVSIDATRLTLPGLPAEVKPIGQTSLKLTSLSGGPSVDSHPSANSVRSYLVGLRHTRYPWTQASVEVLCPETSRLSRSEGLSDITRRFRARQIGDDTHT